LSVGSYSGSEAGSYLRLIDSCITQLKTQGPSRTCNESKKEEEVGWYLDAHVFGDENLDRDLALHSEREGLSA